MIYNNGNIKRQSTRESWQTIHIGKHDNNLGHNSRHDKQIHVLGILFLGTSIIEWSGASI